MYTQPCYDRNLALLVVSTRYLARAILASRSIIKMHPATLSVVLVAGLFGACSAQLCGSNVAFRNNSCLPGPNHKDSPHPEPENAQYEACHQWKNGACCSATFTQQLARATVTNIDGFHWNRCGNLSKSCQEFFVQIECFYRCSPNVAHFERNFPSAFGNLPLCHEFCDRWFDACENDTTCVTNWITDWVYLNGTNTCPDNANCRTYREVYNDSKGICNQLWGPSFFYSDYSENDRNRQCFVPYFPVNSTNPNQVAVQNLFFPDRLAPQPLMCPAHLLSGGQSAIIQQLSLLITLMALLVLMISV